MPKITRVYTRTGDQGTTALSTGERVGKDSQRIGVLGAVDELNSALGLSLAFGVAPNTAVVLRSLQNELFHLGAMLSRPQAQAASHPLPQVEADHVERLERLMDELSGRLQPLANFLLPGGTTGAAQLHVARAVCRRAEHELVRLNLQEPVPTAALRYLNRLSDLLFILARWENHSHEVPDPLWDSRA